MIYSLSGILLEKTLDAAVIECGGVGYWVQVPLSTAGGLPAAGQPCTLYTVMNLTENDVSLFGFDSVDMRNMFRLLTGVSGVGPKVGLAILSALPVSRIALAVSTGDHKAFTAANGVGPKLAQRIVLELKDKVGRQFVGTATAAQAAAAPQTSGVGQAIAALCSLGYSQSDAAEAVAQVDGSLPVQEIIRLALQGIGKGRA